MMRKKINEDAPIGINPLRILINRVGPATRIETYLLQLRSTSRILSEGAWNAKSSNNAENFFCRMSVLVLTYIP